MSAFRIVIYSNCSLCPLASQVRRYGKRSPDAGSYQTSISFTRECYLPHNFSFPNPFFPKLIPETHSPKTHYPKTQNPKLTPQISTARTERKCHFSSYEIKSKQNIKRWIVVRTTCWSTLAGETVLWNHLVSDGDDAKSEPGRDGRQALSTTFQC